MQENKVSKLTPSPTHALGHPGLQVLPGAFVGVAGESVVGDFVGATTTLASAQLFSKDASSKMCFGFTHCRTVYIPGLTSLISINWQSNESS